MDADDIPLYTDFHLYVDQKRILAQVVDARYPEMGAPPEYWHRITGATLWNFLRRQPVDRVAMTVTDPIHLVIMLADLSIAYVRVDFSEYQNFLDHCGPRREAAKADWRAEGF